jgi:hypothetical protein
MGYYMSYILTILFMSLLFCVVMPIVTLFASGFFMFRYYIEKYNMLFVFLKDYESHGEFMDYIITALFIMVIVF